MKAYREATMEDIDAITVVDEQGTQWTNGDLRKSLANEIAAFDKDVEWNKKKEDFWAELYTWAGHIAQITFGLGLVLLLLFAIANS
jgi:cell division protein FtsX